MKKYLSVLLLLLLSLPSLSFADGKVPLTTTNNNWSGNQTHSGTEAFLGPETHSGTVTHSGAETFTNVNNTHDYINGSRLRGQTYDAWGDSITFGVGASTTANSWASKVASGHGWTLTNHGVSGDQNTDMATHVLAYTPTVGGIHSVLIGQNDTCTQGDSTPSINWLASYEASIAYLLTPNKITGQSSAAVKAGTWSNSSLSPMGIQTSTNGDTITLTLTGTTLLIGMHANLSNSSSVSVSVDGSLIGTYTPAISFTTTKGVAHGPYLIRIPNLSNKSHTVVLTSVITSGTLYFDWASGNLNQNASLFLMSPYRGAMSATAAVNCRKQWDKAVREILADGLNLFPVDIQAACDDVNGAALCTAADGVHPNDAGHTIIANTVLSAADNFAWKHPSPARTDERGCKIFQNDLGFVQQCAVYYTLSANTQRVVTLALSPDSNTNGTPKSFGFSVDLHTSFATRHKAHYEAAGNVTNAGSTGNIEEVYHKGTDAVILHSLTPVDNTTLQFTIANTQGSTMRGVMLITSMANDDVPFRGITQGAEAATTVTTPVLNNASVTLNSLVTPTASSTVTMGGFTEIFKEAATGSATILSVTADTGNSNARSLFTVDCSSATNCRPFSFNWMTYTISSALSGFPTMTPNTVATSGANTASRGWRWQGSCWDGAAAQFDSYDWGTTYAAGSNPVATTQLNVATGCGGSRLLNTRNFTKFLADNVNTNTSSNTDLAGFVTLNTGSGTYTFTKTYTSAPVCTATDTTAVNAVKASANTTTLTLTGTGSDVIAYICVGRN